jgi:hypothetical protein
MLLACTEIVWPARRPVQICHDIHAVAGPTAARPAPGPESPAASRPSAPASHAINDHRVAGPRSCRPGSALRAQRPMAIDSRVPASCVHDQPSSRQPDVQATSSPGREGQEDHHEQEEQVEPQEQLIGPGELVGQGGVHEPGDADGQEADDIRQVAGPGVQHLLQRCARRAEGEVQYQQSGGESVYAVAESFHPVLAQDPAPARGVFVSWHGTVSFASACRRWQSMRIGPPAVLPGSTGPDCPTGADPATRRRPADEAPGRVTKDPGRADLPLMVSSRGPTGYSTPVRWGAGMTPARSLALTGVNSQQGRWAGWPCG